MGGRAPEPPLYPVSTPGLLDILKLEHVSVFIPSVAAAQQSRRTRWRQCASEGRGPGLPL